jgi:serine O-acetyltransferase
MHDMNRIIASDLYRFNKLTGIRGLITGLRIPAFKYILLFRLINILKSGIICSFIRLLKRHYSYKYGFQIPSNVKIGKGLYIGHYGTVVINPDVVIGENCNLAHNTTIGQANRGKSAGVPVIGDNVWIGTGSVIVGKIVVGSNVLIAPNSFVNMNVPCNSLVIGNPATIKPKENPCEGYINNLL